jgi:hypothetical protein
MYHVNDADEKHWDKDLGDNVLTLLMVLKNTKTFTIDLDASSSTWTTCEMISLLPTLTLYSERTRTTPMTYYRKYHDDPTAGHPGQLGTYHAIARYYWWPGLRSFVTAYVQGCAECQKYKIDRSPTKPALQGIDSSKNTRPFAQPSMDLITGLPPSDGYNAISSRGGPQSFEGGDSCPQRWTQRTPKDTALSLQENIYSNDLDYQTN